VPMLLVEVTQAWEAATTAEATRIMTMLAAETSVQEATAAQDSAALRVKDAEDRAALVEKEALQRMSRVKAKNAVVLASAREDVEGLIRKIALFEGELVAEYQAQEVSERERLEQFEELTILQIQGSELCHAIIGPPQARHHLSEGKRLAALHHTEMAEELVVPQVVVSSTVELVLGRSPSDNFHVEVVGELAIEFQKMEERRSWLERPATRICDLLHGTPSSRA
jgi:hypothetical protein